jgi:hypothetical protein
MSSVFIKNNKIIFSIVLKTYNIHTFTTFLFLFTLVVHWYIIRAEVVNMATNKPRYTVTVDNELFEEIEKFRYENRFQARSEATIELIKKGIEVIKNNNADREDDGNHRPFPDLFVPKDSDNVIMLDGLPEEERKVLRDMFDLLSAKCKGGEK